MAGKVLPHQDFGIVDGVSSVELHDCTHDPVPRELIVVASSIAQNKGDIVNYGNYRGIKLMCHSMKLYERVHENRLRNIVSISDEQFGFVNGKSTTDAILALRQLQERYREGPQDLH